MHEPESPAHLTSYRTYVIVWLGLIILTALTVTSAYLNLGEISTIISIFIASMKAALVLLFFMHLKEEGKAPKYTFTVTVILLAIFLIGVYTDAFFLMRK